ncbi:MAG TPA: peptidoglycan-binding domain-containing protein [Stellaceae bacterium]|nr:peptidoglycan-binding domain-containing protein [Stellaceae bacterium]
MPSTDNGAPNAMQNQTGGTAQGPQANAQDQTQGQMGQGQMGQGGRRAEVQQAQQQLKSQGLYRGAVDGIDGPGTRMALRRFQKEQGLRQSAQLDQQTLDRLNGANSGMNGNATPPTTVPNATGTTNTGSGNFNNGHTTGTTTPNR